MKKILVILCLFLAPLHAVEDWETFTVSDLPQSLVNDMIVFNNTLFVGRSASLLTVERPMLAMSFDGETWKEVGSFPVKRDITCLGVHKGWLYAFTQRGTTDPTPYATEIYKSSDGLTWISVPLPNNKPGWRFQKATSFGDHLYTIGLDVQASYVRSIWRTTGESPVVWEELPMQVGTHANQFVHLNGALIVACFYVNNYPQPSSTRFYKTSDGINWTTIYEAPNMPFIHPFPVRVEAFKNSLFFDDLNQGILSELKPNGEIISHNLSGVPVVVHEQIYLPRHFNSPPTQGLLELGENGQFQAANLGGAEHFWQLLNSVHFQDKCFIIASSDGVMPALHRLKKGATQVILNQVDAQEVVPGLNNNEPVLMFNISHSVRETLQGLTLVNTGTAEAGRDIRSLKLYQQVIGNTIFLADLESAADGKTWSTPAGFSRVLIEGLPFVMRADVAPTAREGRTMQFSIPQNGFVWKESQTYQNPTLTNSLALTISANPNAAAEAPIDGVLAYPVPARDTARLTYDLDSDAEVNVKIYDRTQALVSEINETQTGPGRATTIWDASSAARGAYYALIKIKESTGRERTFNKKIYIEK